MWYFTLKKKLSSYEINQTYRNLLILIIHIQPLKYYLVE